MIVPVSTASFQMRCFVGSFVELGDLGVSQTRLTPLAPPVREPSITPVSTASLQLRCSVVLGAPRVSKSNAIVHDGAAGADDRSGLHRQMSLPMLCDGRCVLRVVAVSALG